VFSYSHPVSTEWASFDTRALAVSTAIIYLTNQPNERRRRSRIPAWGNAPGITQVFASLTLKASASSAVLRHESSQSSTREHLQRSLAAWFLFPGALPPGWNLPTPLAFDY